MNAISAVTSRAWEGGMVPLNEGTHRLMDLFAKNGSSAKSLWGRVVWLKEVMVAVCLCVPILGHALWYFPYVGEAWVSKNELGPVSKAGVQIPEIGLPNLGNSCWLNSVCQVILRTPTLVNRIVSMKKSEDLLILHLNGLIDAMCNDESKVRGCMERFLKYAAELSGHEVGAPNDGVFIFDKLIQILGLALSGCSYDPSSNQCGKPFASNRIICFSSTLKHPQTFTGALQSCQGYRLLVKIPPLIVFQLQTPESSNWIDEQLPNSVQFGCFLIGGTRRTVSYRLSAATIYSGNGLSGHHTAQQINPPRYYDDAHVSSHGNISERLKRSVISVWEIEDPSLIDPSYLKTVF